MVQNKEKDMKFAKLPISELELDVNNPRIAHWLKMYHEITQDNLYLALGVGDPSSSESGPSFHSLREAIKTNKGVIHPILVNKKQSGKYTVIEGNTRVAIYIDFKKNGTEGDWSSIPCIIYENLSGAEVDAIRLQAHLVGVRAWAPYAKAKYLAFLRDCEHLTWNQIVDYCGGKKKETEELVSAYRDMEKYYRQILEDDSSFDETRFSAFVELQKPKIKESIINAGFNLSDFSKWIHERYISRLENVRRLPVILGQKKAKEVFLSKGDKAAIAIIDATLIPAEPISLTIAQLAKNLAERLRKINLEDIRRYKEDLSASEPSALFEVKEELISLFELLKVDD